MATTINWKDILDLQEWRPRAVAPNAHAAGGCIAGDLRNDESRHPYIYQLVSNTVLNAYDVKNDGWMYIGSPALAGTFGIGANMTFMGHRGPRGVLKAGCNTTTLVATSLQLVSPIAAMAWTRAAAVITFTKTAHGLLANQYVEVTVTSDAAAIPVGVYLVTAVATDTFNVTGLAGGGAAGTATVNNCGYVCQNQLANRGDGVGYKIRVIGLTTGKTEESYITANTASAVPTLTIAPALTFSPSAGDLFEILSGKVMMVGAGTVASGSWQAYDVACNVFTWNQAFANLPTAATDSNLICLDEQRVPVDQVVGEGFLGKITATAVAPTTIQSVAAQGDAAVLQNEYRNFQIRIVEDTVNPTANGQRRLIQSHTAGPNPTYTVAAWTVQPSTSAVYVIENPNYIIYCTGGQTNTYTYTMDGTSAQAADTWNTGTFGARGTAPGAGVMSYQPFGLADLDANKTIRYSHICYFRGGAVFNTMDVLDIAGGANGLWTNASTTYPNIGTYHATALSAGACGEYASQDNGRYFYIRFPATQLFFRFDVLTRNMVPMPMLRYTDTAVLIGARMTTTGFFDGSTGIAVILLLRNTATELFDFTVMRPL